MRKHQATLRYISSGYESPNGHVQQILLDILIEFATEGTRSRLQWLQIDKLVGKMRLGQNCVFVRTFVYLLFVIDLYLFCVLPLLFPRAKLASSHPPPPPALQV